MKNIFLSFAFFLLGNYAQATIRRVNNNAGVSTAYVTAQSAHDAATAGDTILIDGSPNTTYVTCTKQLVWIGSGYFLNQPPYPQWNQNSSKCLISMSSGSSNSKIIGIEGSFDISTSNIAISRCKASSIQFSGNGNINCSITDCFISSEGNSVASISSWGISSGDNILIANNFISGTNGNFNFGGINLNGNFTGINIYNNIFLGYQGGHPILIGYGVIKNNIFNNNSNSTFSLNNANVSNNLFMNVTNTAYVGNNGNIFVSGNLTTTNSVLQGVYSNLSDTWMKLKIGSPAIGAGEGGIDIGPFGGTNPYILSGIPPTPTIFGFQANSTPGNVLPCVISTRSNN